MPTHPLLPVLAASLFLALPADLPAQQDRAEAEAAVTLPLRNEPLKEAVAAIGRRGGATVLIGEDVDASVTVDLVDVGWRTALAMVAEEAGCVVVTVDKTLLKVERPPRVFFSGTGGEPVAQVLEEIARLADRRILVDPDVCGAITLRLDRPWRELLDATVETLGYTVVEEASGLLRVVPPGKLTGRLVTRRFDCSHVTGRGKTQRSRLQQAVRHELSINLGKAEFQDGDTLVVTDLPPVLDRIAALVASRGSAFAGRGPIGWILLLTGVVVAVVAMRRWLRA